MDATTPPPTPDTLALDFNETLVRERMLPAWCRDRLRRSGPGERVRLGLAVVAFGGLSIAADVLGADAVAARIGFRVLAGVAVHDLVEWARTRLTPSDLAFAALARHAAGRRRLLVLSRGSPEPVVRAVLERDDVRRRLGALGLLAAVEVVAPRLETRADRLTGRVLGPVLGKRRRLRSLPAGTLFLGDRRDRRLVHRMRRRRFRFACVDAGAEEPVAPGHE
jgi:phosphoserine phosphatase